ncbi:capsular biosynthesis protein [Achromobacter sp. MYb9]|nr:capsular biosynthesis protein [Achromobacter sp. MYb9]
MASTWALECLLIPRPVAPWRRPLAATAVHLGVWTLAFAFELLLFRRPYFAVANVLAIQLLVVLVSNAKYQALREPFVFPDFEYFTDAIRHPRLYLPFVSIWAIVLPAIGYAGLCYAAFRLEPGLLEAPGGVGHYVFALFVLTAFGVILCAGGRLLRPDFDAQRDLVRFGLLASLVSYWRAEQKVPELSDHFGFPPSGGLVANPAPDLVSIQSESFFDARQTYPALRKDLLSEFDALRAEALVHGALTVPAWGANTVRSEFAFLAGQAQGTLGVHRFNPYRRLAAFTTPSFVRLLKAQGYRTVCIHPYHATFYRRNVVLPKLGFDEFIDIAAFGQEDRQGPYVGDKAVAEKVIAMLRRSDPRPLYVHVITMENHGPLHWEQVAPEEYRTVATQPLPDDCSDLIVYARHLRNADAMFSSITGYLREHDRAASLCVYGDHVPIMAEVYRTLGEPPGTTPYAIWHNRVAGRGGEQPAALECLASIWLRECYSA